MKVMFKRESLGMVGVFVLLSIVLLFSLFLHSLQVTHAHQHSHQASESSEGTGDTFTFGEYSHAAEKKLFVFLLSLFVLGAGVQILLPNTLSQFIAYRERLVLIFLRSGAFLRMFTHYLQMHFGNGVLHPKLY